MLITGKIIDIEKNSIDRDIYTVILEKTRKGKKILIPVTFWGHLSKDIPVEFTGKPNPDMPPDPLDWPSPKERPLLKIGMRIDVHVYIYGKSNINYGKKFWDSYIVAESWRPYVPGSKRYLEIVNKETGEVIKRKAELPRDYDKV